MDKIEITLFNDEGVPELTDRLGFALMELGVKLRVKEFHDDHTTFEFSKAGPLDDDNSKKEG